MNRVIHSDIPVLMGIVNITPDSFSDGGKYLDPQKAIEHGLKLYQEGAAILDIGGESTRPGATPVQPDEEIARVIPVIEGLRDSGAVMSIDTRHAKTMEAALKAGATLINDVTALEGDPESLRVATNSGAMVSLMHMQGDPRTMQDAPEYNDVLADVYGYLSRRIEMCLDAGITQDRIMIDPGIGFGKTLEQNVTLLKNIDHFKTLGVPLLLGTSRKRFIEGIHPGTNADARVPGSIASVLAAYQKGIRLFRVHDVAETAQAINVFRAVS